MIIVPLIVTSVISGIATLLVAATFMVPVLGLRLFEGGDIGPLGFVMLFLFYVTQYFVIFFFNTALVDSQFATLESPVGEAGVLRLDALLSLPTLQQQASAWLATRGRLASTARRALCQAASGLKWPLANKDCAAVAQPSSASRCACQRLRTRSAASSGVTRPLAASSMRA